MVGSKLNFDLDNLTAASRLLITNGYYDGWSVTSIVETSWPGVKTLFMRNASHHSELTGEGPSDKDTADVKQAQEEIVSIIRTWLDEIHIENSGD